MSLVDDFYDEMGRPRDLSDSPSLPSFDQVVAECRLTTLELADAVALRQSKCEQGVAESRSRLALQLFQRVVIDGRDAS